MLQSTPTAKVNLQQKKLVLTTKPIVSMSVNNGVKDKNDPYFYGKSSLKLHGRDVRQSCNGLFLSAHSQMSEIQISTLWKQKSGNFLLHFYKQNEFH